jgi:hypothetical protein
MCIKAYHTKYIHIRAQTHNYKGQLQQLLPEWRAAQVRPGIMHVCMLYIYIICYIYIYRHTQKNKNAYTYYILQGHRDDGYFWNGELAKCGWSHASRTDRGVHAIGQCVAFDLGANASGQDEHFYVNMTAEVNKHLAAQSKLYWNSNASDIRVYGMKQVWPNPAFGPTHVFQWRVLAYDFRCVHMILSACICF